MKHIFYSINSGWDSLQFEPWAFFVPITKKNNLHKKIKTKTKKYRLIKLNENVNN